jgi:hypothetical protein
MPQTADKTGFKPKAIVKKLLTSLPERSRTVLEARFGLGTNSEKVTLEAIGKRWGITRERVRQIENHALAALKKSPAYARHKAAFGELERIVDSLGGIVCEQDLLDFITKDKSMQNHIYFLLCSATHLNIAKKTTRLSAAGMLTRKLADKVEGALKQALRRPLRRGPDP